MSHLYIITGASKGIGEALANQLESDGGVVLRIARSNPNNLDNLDNLDNFLSADITDLATLDTIEKWIDNHIATAKSITLINNAGTVEPIGVVGLIDPEKVNHAFNLNVTAPINLTNRFVKRLQTIDLPKYVMNISSGAGRNAYSGWGVYCATKAALDHFTRVFIEEQKSAQYPVFATSIAPGVIDTDMQSTIRDSSEEAFPNVGNFRHLKESGSLASPEETAAGLIRFLKSEKMTASQAISDIRKDT